MKGESGEELRFGAGHLDACRDLLRLIDSPGEFDVAEVPYGTLACLANLIHLSDDDWRRYMQRWCGDLLRAHIVAVESDGVVRRFADDGCWPWRGDDPRWVAIVEGAGGYEACRAAVAQMDDGRHTTAEVFARLDEKDQDNAKA